jgi:hypothetical protein
MSLIILLVKPENITIVYSFSSSTKVKMSLAMFFPFLITNNNIHLAFLKNQVKKKNARRDKLSEPTKSLKNMRKKAFR